MEQRECSLEIRSYWAYGGWHGHFRALADQAGAHCNVIPAAVLRDSMERVVDNQSVATADDMDLAVIAALRGKNSLVHFRGRPPYMAAFGR